jgi:hypothetical protein
LNFEEKNKRRWKKEFWILIKINNERGEVQYLPKNFKLSNLFSSRRAILYEFKAIKAAITQNNKKRRKKSDARKNI